MIDDARVPQVAPSILSGPFTWMIMSLCLILPTITHAQKFDTSGPRWLLDMPDRHHMKDMTTTGSLGICTSYYPWAQVPAGLKVSKGIGHVGGRIWNFDDLFTEPFPVEFRTTSNFSRFMVGLKLAHRQSFWRVNPSLSGQFGPGYFTTRYFMSELHPDGAQLLDRALILRDNTAMYEVRFGLEICMHSRADRVQIRRDPSNGRLSFTTALSFLGSTGSVRYYTQPDISIEEHLVDGRSIGRDTILNAFADVEPMETVVAFVGIRAGFLVRF